MEVFGCKSWQQVTQVSPGRELFCVSCSEKTCYKGWGEQKVERLTKYKVVYNKQVFVVGCLAGAGRFICLWDSKTPSKISYFPGLTWRIHLLVYKFRYYSASQDIHRAPHVVQQSLIRHLSDFVGTNDRLMRLSAAWQVQQTNQLMNNLDLKRLRRIAKAYLQNFKRLLAKISRRAHVVLDLCYHMYFAQELDIKYYQLH